MLDDSRNHWYRETVKNVTVSMDEETARWARVEAACNDMSVSRFVGLVLRERMASSEDFERAQRSYLSRRAQRLGSGDGHLARRDEIHRR